MAIDLDDEILQDFLVEAGEILDLLSEQLVQLEQAPDDYDLLNAIFRGFHTVKGGAGFLGIEALVEVCHKAEDVFNMLRQGDRKITADLMDVVLQVLDVVNEMFGRIRSGQYPAPAKPELLIRLKAYTEQPGATDSISVTEEQTTRPIIAPPSVTDLVEQEFETMLNLTEDDTSRSSTDPMADEITEEEFEELLDALHGKGGSPSSPVNRAVSETTATDSGDITEEEFENLLDELHGKGKFVGVPHNELRSAPKTESEPGTVEPSLRAERFNASTNKSETAARPTEPSTQSETEVKTSAGEGRTARHPNHSDKNQTRATTAPVETTVRVDTQVLDDIMNMVGELVLVRNRLQTLKSVSDSDDQMTKAIANLDLVTADLQLAVMKTRMQPIKKVFGRFPRVVRDLARSLNKEIRLELVGEETDLDKNLVEALADPLVHLVRNAVDHGIESPEDRLAEGKPREGLIVLTASQQGDHIELSIKDDGKGMNADALRTKVIEKGLMDAESAARLDQKECFNLIFMPGFSTKTEISDVSGRGVGMDVVKTRITQMNGTVEVDSQQGAGSMITIKVPLTLAIMPTLMVKLGGQAFALPLASVLEILDLDLRVTNVVDGQPVVMVRNKALPLFYLGEWLVKDPNYTVMKHVPAHVVVVNAGGRHVGFVVDQLIGQEEVVIKALGAKLQGVGGLAGATITGDGRIALILDVPGLMKRYAG